METNQDFARRLVCGYYNSRVEKTDEDALLYMNDVYIVWFSYVLGNWKALVSTNVSDGMYYEVTYRTGSPGETYLDAYKKWENVRYEDEGPS